MFIMLESQIKDKVLYWVIPNFFVRPPAQKFIVYEQNKWNFKQARCVFDVSPDGTVLDARYPYEDDFQK